MRPVCSHVHVKVPATSANLGPGFDAVGIALRHYDEVSFSVHDPAVDADDMRIIIHGEGEHTLPRDSTNLVVSTFLKACRTFGLGDFGFTMEAVNTIPQARGMGSSAEAIVAGICAAAALSQQGGLNRDAVFDLAAGIEGHPDNVAPAVFGGLSVSWNLHTAEGVGSIPIPGGKPIHSGFHAVMYPVDPAITATVFVPNVELSTAQARRALPESVPRRDAVTNVSRAALLPAALNPQSVRGVVDPNALLFSATQDRLHQQYRKSLMLPSWHLIEALRHRGYAAMVSGAGPSVLVLHYGDDDGGIERAAAGHLATGHWTQLNLAIDTEGVQVHRSNVDSRGVDGTVPDPDKE